MEVQVLNKYLNLFGSLHRYNKIAPHKPILLISILDQIEQGHISENQITLSTELVAAFRENWEILPLPPGSWLQRVWVPFRYLLQDGFWQLIKNEEVLTSKEIGDPHSVMDLQRYVNYARFSPDLWNLLQERTARNVLRQHLLQVYFGVIPGQIQPMISSNPVGSQLQKLIAESQSQPRQKKLRETADGTKYFLRHQLFPEIIRALYDEQCAVCGLSAQAGSQSVLESAHIKPFAVFHDDHPSNGLALCRNHHWGFDAGGFSIADDYSIVVSPRMKHTFGYIESGVNIHLPSAESCYPSLTALTYHRDNVLLK